MKEAHGWITTDGTFFDIEKTEEASNHQSKLDLEAAAPDLLYALDLTIKEFEYSLHNSGVFLVHDSEERQKLIDNNTIVLLAKEVIKKATS